MTYTQIVKNSQSTLSCPFEIWLLPPENNKYQKSQTQLESGKARPIHRHCISMANLKENSDFVCFEILVKYLTQSGKKPFKVIIWRKFITWHGF